MGSDQPEFELCKYARMGYFNDSRHSDRLLAEFLKELPGDGYLPSRWKYTSVDDFNTRYSHLGLLLWSASRSSHLLVISGQRVVRIWTDASHHCWVDGLTHLINVFPMELIPSGCNKKSKPFKYRVKITENSDMSTLAKNIKSLYGVGNA